MSILPVRPTAGLTYALADTVNYWRSGIGTSRRAIEQKEGGESPFIHSGLTLQRYVGCLNDFKDFCRTNGVNRIDRITPGTLSAFYKHKEGEGHGKENGQRRLLSEKTMKIHLAVQTKFFTRINRQDLVDYINETRGEILAPCRPFEKTQALTRPEAVIAGMKHHPHQVMGELQLLTGARVGDLKKMLLSGSRLIISDSKGGLTRINRFSDRPQDRDRIEKLLADLENHTKSSDWGWAKMFKTYGDDYREGCRKAGELKVSPHAFRSSYVHRRVAQLEAAANGEKKAVEITDRTFGPGQKVERYIDKNIASKYVSEGFSGALVVTYHTPAGKKKETEYNLAHYQVSLEIGHRRTEITRYYLDG